MRNKMKSTKIRKNYLQIEPPPEGLMVDSADTYGSDALPKSKNVDTAMVCQTLSQLPPANKLRKLHIEDNNNLKPIRNPKDKNKVICLLVWY